MSSHISNKLSYFSVALLPRGGITLDINLIASAFRLVFDDAFAIVSEEHSTISFINIC